MKINTKSFKNLSKRKFHSTSSKFKWKLDLNAPMWKTMNQIPKLPILPLKDTCERYLEYLDPLIDHPTKIEVQKLTDHFLKVDGPPLQELLVNLDKEAQRSWIEGYWLSMYIEDRSPVPINVSPFLLLEDDPKRQDNISRASNILFKCASFWKLIYDQQLPPDFEKTEPLDMMQYTKIFGTSRIPKFGRDFIKIDRDSNYIIVIIKDHFFKLEIFDEHRQPISEEILADSLRKLEQKAHSSHSVLPVGMFTNDNRDRWAGIRRTLGNSKQNEHNLKVIDDALFVLCLEDLAPTNLQTCSNNLLFGDGTNRWHDKFQVVVYRNGKAGNVFEHSVIDGHTTIGLWNYVCGSQENKNAKYHPSHNAVAHSEPLVFEISPEIKHQIEDSRKLFHSFTNTLENHVLEFNSYGTDYIKKNKISPDAYVQMSYQIAYYLLFGKVDSTYESANTKRFAGGRTECLRSVTNESLEMCKIWATHNSTPAQKIASLRKACEKHVNRMNEAKNGRGVDRHLFGLKQLALHKRQRIYGYELPQLFEHPSYSKLMTSVISTSNVSADAFRLFGFGPVTPPGLGLAYSLKNSSFLFNVTAFEQHKAIKFSNQLEKTLKEIQSLLDHQHK